MTTYLKNISFILGLSFLLACGAYVPPAGYNQNLPSGGQQPTFPGQLPPPYTDGQQTIYNPPPPPSLDDDEDDRNRKDGCKYEDKDHECRDYCKQMFRSSGDRKDCLKLEESEIEDMFDDVHERLKDPSGEDLDGINVEDLKAYFDVSISGFQRLISSEYKRTDAEEVLIWIMQNEEVTELFIDEDDDYKTFELLLEEATGSFNDNKLEKPLGRDIDSDDTLIELAEENETALDWLLEYVFETATQCDSDNPVQQNCFEVICKIGAKFGDDRHGETNRSDWLIDSGDFENYIEDIIDANINKDRWKTDEGNISDISDLDDNYDNDFLNLCGGLY